MSHAHVVRAPAGAASAGTARHGGVPRLGFLGLGWIGTTRLEALIRSGAGIVSAIADSSAERLASARERSPDAVAVDSLDALLDLDLDGIVIATPSALHAGHCERALERGYAVFCQKPLARTAAETRRVIDSARAADRLLGVDLSYRHAAAVRAVRDAVRSGGAGRVYAADLVFHNAYGPNMGWARDPALAGGGCVIDLGIHLVDLALWVLDFPAVRSVTGQRYAGGRRLRPDEAVCEDYAAAVIELEDGASVRIACSWELSAGRDAVIGAAFHGTTGGVAVHNVNGSFYDFTASLNHGASSTILVEPPDDWGGRALSEWSRRLGADARYDEGVESLLPVAAVLDRMLEQ
jgi:predicted dehydrogenase